VMNNEEKTSWYGQKTKLYIGTLPQLIEHIPYFEKVPFAVNKIENEYYHTILSFQNNSPGPVPVAIVSKQYELVQHYDILMVIAGALENIKIDPRQVQTELCLSAYGEKMRFRAIFPHYDLDPGDGHPVGMRLTCFNSVDRTSALEFYIEWYRLVCSNGMLQEELERFRRIHQWPLTIGDVAAYLKEHFERFPKEGQNLVAMLSKKVNKEDLISWVNNDVAQRWGNHQAARVLHICRTGFDAVVLQGNVRMQPDQYPMKKLQQVPGAPKDADNAYHICQALTWVAQQSRTIQGQWEKTKDVTRLLAKLKEVA